MFLFCSEFEPSVQIPKRVYLCQCRDLELFDHVHTVIMFYYEHNTILLIIIPINLTTNMFTYIIIIYILCYIMLYTYILWNIINQYL